MRIVLRKATTDHLSAIATNVRRARFRTHDSAKLTIDNSAEFGSREALVPSRSWTHRDAPARTIATTAPSGGFDRRGIETDCPIGSGYAQREHVERVSKATGLQVCGVVGADAVEYMLIPAALNARTQNRYSVPFRRSVIV